MHRIVYLSWPASEISGGIKLTFRHVEYLRSLGMTAEVATPDGARPTWFDTTVEPIIESTIEINQDLLVLPENNQDLVQKYKSWPNPKYLFCQNQYMVCRGFGTDTEITLSGILCEGEAVYEYCDLRFPGVPRHYVPVVISDSFHLSTEKLLQIAYMPRKRPLEAMFIRDLFQVMYPDLAELPWVEIAGKSETQVARIMRESAVFLSLARLESVGMAAIEAMASGCVVAGFAGIGGNEYRSGANGLWVEEDHCVECVRALKRAVDIVRDKEAHSRYVERSLLTAANYSEARLISALSDAWKATIPGRA